VWACLLLHFKPRSEERTKAMIRARLRGAGPERDVCILNVSPSGLMGTTADPPRPGRYIELIVGNHSLVGQVKWASERRFGVALRDRISVFALITGDSDPLTIKQREQERKRRSRSAAGAVTSVRRIELVFVFAAAAAATLFLADYVGTALHSLDGVKQALAGNPGGLER